MRDSAGDTVRDTRPAAPSMPVPLPTVSGTDSGTLSVPSGFLSAAPLQAVVPNAIARRGCRSAGRGRAQPGGADHRPRQSPRVLPRSRHRRAATRGADMTLHLLPLPRPWPRDEAPPPAPADPHDERRLAHQSTGPVFARGGPFRLPGRRAARLAGRLILPG